MASEKIDKHSASTHAEGIEATKAASTDAVHGAAPGEYSEFIAMGEELFGQRVLPGYVKAAASVYNEMKEILDVVEDGDTPRDSFDPTAPAPAEVPPIHPAALSRLTRQLLVAYGLHEYDGTNQYDQAARGALGLPAPEDAERIAMFLGQHLVEHGPWRWTVTWVPPKLPGDLAFAFCLARDDDSQLLFPGSWIKLAVFGFSPEASVSACPGLAWALRGVLAGQYSS